MQQRSFQQMFRWMTVAVLAAAALLTGCAAEPEPEAERDAAEPAPPPTAQERAQAAAGEFSGRLRAALRDHMGSEGPVSALAFCHDQAPQIAAEVMAGHGLSLGRVAISGRERNPAHAPSAWQQPILERFAAAVAAGQAPEDQVAIIRDGLPEDVALRMMRGIRVEPQCQLCHGRELSPGIADEVARLYPDDRAIGFVEGDLRGALWIEVPQSTEESGARQ